MKTAASIIVCIISVFLIAGTAKAVMKPFAQISTALTQALNVSEIPDRGIRN